jgi:murein DD-endopeptidase MepM/ murein hydrolase activator NlpD
MILQIQSPIFALFFIKHMYKKLFYIFISIVAILSSCSNEIKTPVSESKPEVTIPKFKYGINIDSLHVVTDEVKKNEFLSDILLKYGIDYSTIDYIARFTKDTFDVRKLRRGNKYTVLCTNDSLRRALYFAYEISPTDYVLYHLKDSIFAIRGHKQITTQVDTISGHIESSLWNALVDQNADPNLANELSEIYAWTIDFFGLRKGDTYEAIFEKLYVNEQYIGLGKVLAAKFNHMGEDYLAFYFEQNGSGDYFDEEGNSLQRTFLKAPLRFTRISSRFSNSRLHPVLKIRRPHHGIDYAAPTGTPVHTVGDGVVVDKGYQKRGGGNYVKIKHNGTYSTSYMHLSGYAKGIVVGKKVKQGELIGYVGSTGLATGPHLDFRFYRNGRAIDPLKVESPPSKPIDTSYQVQFDSIVGIYIDQLKLSN